MIGVKDAKTGIRITGNLVNLNVALNAGALAVFQLSNDPLQRGNKTFRLIRVKMLDQGTGGGGTLVHFGIGAAGAVVDSMPPLRTVNLQNADFGEGDLPRVEFSQDLMAYPDVASVFVQVECEELG